jgi:hypothetical protein
MKDEKNIGEAQNTTMTMDQLKKSGLKIKDSNKVNMRYKCLKLIDVLVSHMYSPGALLLMQKQGYSVEKKDIDEAKEKTKKKLFLRHVEGKTTKQLTGAISNIQADINKFNF